MYLYMDNRKFFLLGLTSMMLAACSTDSGMMNEYDRISANFKEQINGNIDRSHLWRTMVTLHVRVTSDEPITLYACSQETDDQVILFDKKEQETAGGTIDLVVPQGYGNSVVLYVVYKGESYKREIELTGIPTQVIDVDTDQLTDELPSVSTAKNQSVSASFSRSATNQSLYGETLFGTPSYREFNVEYWKEVAALAKPSGDPSQKGEIVNYELVSNGPFEVSMLCGYAAAMSPHILGYYYHSKGTYDDLKFVDLLETHRYDYYNGLAKVQYQLDGIDKWYDANFDMGDDPLDDSDAYVTRRGDDAYNTLWAWKRYGDRITKIRGVMLPINVPKGMRLGFYLRMDSEQNAEQRERIVKRGIPSSELPTDFRATNFSAKVFNINGTHRSWYKNAGKYTFMGMEDISQGGDLDCNDVMFGISTSLEYELPTIVNPDIDAMIRIDENLPWTIAYEDLSHGTDYDFNDAVIQVSPDIDNEQAEVKVLAAGSEVRMWLHYDGPDGDVNLGEIHELLGRPVEPVNTEQAMVTTPFAEIGHVAWPASYSMATDAKRFYIEMKHGSCSDCTFQLTLPYSPGVLPQAILVAGEWKWPKEGVNIMNVYDTFADWSKDITKMAYWNWYSYPKSNTYVNY